MRRPLRIRTRTQPRRPRGHGEKVIRPRNPISCKMPKQRRTPHTYTMSPVTDFMSATPVEAEAAKINLTTAKIAILHTKQANSIHACPILTWASLFSQVALRCRH
ncbi:hypothetical protein MUK42_13349 [Musa troglodytarum]|uniref:Uncharacterized protein n=1 Tax=Musa troglodytarum TaxID=320322 RepID=A0A9E7L9C6_9LILI|nr:hypothetical protein MUK42_13349 [Musa troglodytarum]